MKDNISIIFAALIGTFLIIILPLYSILDRQDSMSYNVVLTETTNFVDNIRNNGFLDKESYYNYITALATTGNTYKVNIEAYRKILIPDTDEHGNVINDSYVEEIELYNTKDILEVIEGQVANDTLNSNKKDNVYLFKENDEIYVKVYNTNTTSGSILYTALAGPTDNKVIDISYGGIINDINWDLYNKIEDENVINPEVIMSVPVNRDNSTNIVKLNEDGTIGDIDCRQTDLSIEEIGICEDLEKNGLNDGYEYLYDLSLIENRTIKLSIELKGVDKIDIGSTTTNYVFIPELYNLGSEKNDALSNIASKYIKLNGMYADKLLTLRSQGDYYIFNLTLTNVKKASLDYSVVPASITILPGLGQSSENILSLGADSVEIKVSSPETKEAIQIRGPYNYKKVLKDKSFENALITDNTVYTSQQIAFVINFNIGNKATTSINKDNIITNLKIYSTEYSNLSVNYGETYENTSGIKLPGGGYLVTFTYDFQRNIKDNYIQLLGDWVWLEDDTLPEGGYYLKGTKSESYTIETDALGPNQPLIEVEGTKGKDNWYRSDVTLKLIEQSDRMYRVIETATEIYKTAVNKGIGIDKNIFKVTGANVIAEQDVNNNSTFKLTKSGTSTATATSYDYLGNASFTANKEIKIDKQKPTEPKVIIESGQLGENEWYKSNVKVKIIPGEDALSGVDETKYIITGENATEGTIGTNGTSYTFTKEGKSTLTVTTKDKAGNSSTKTVEINIEKTTPKAPEIKVLSGNKNSADNEWYISDVTLSITREPSSASGIQKFSYEVISQSSVFGAEIVDNIEEINLTKTGIYTIRAYITTTAGNVVETTKQIKIDKDKPNNDNYSILGMDGQNEWYTSQVKLSIGTSTDVGSGYDKTVVKVTGANNIQGTYKEYNSHTLSNSGRNTVVITTYDVAGNITEQEFDINIEKTNTINDKTHIGVLEGTLGLNEWYTSPVKLKISAKDEDYISGIESITYTVNGVSQNTNESNEPNTIQNTFNYSGNYDIKITTLTKAGNRIFTSYTLKIDTGKPSSPSINIDQEAQNDLVGVKLFNGGITGTIKAGTDGISGVLKTTYEITKNNGTIVVVAEREGTSFSLNQEGDFTITARTYDKAGNVNEVSQAVSINKAKPIQPQIVKINETSTIDLDSMMVTGATGNLQVVINKLGIGNTVVIKLLNESTYEEISHTFEARSASMQREITLNKEGTYKITVTQMNMYGTESDVSSGYYRYQFKK